MVDRYTAHPPTLQQAWSALYTAGPELHDSVMCAAVNEYLNGLWHDASATPRLEPELKIRSDQSILYYQFRASTQRELPRFRTQEREILLSTGPALRDRKFFPGSPNQ